MSLEQEIKQEKFPSQRIKALVNITFTSNYLGIGLKQRIEPFGITLQQFNVLRILRGQYPGFVSNTQIKERMIDKMPDTSRLIDRLEIKALVEKHKCNHDKRLVDIRITEKGLDLLKDLDSIEEDFENFMKNISEEESGILNSILDKIRGSVISEGENNDTTRE